MIKKILKYIIWMTRSCELWIDDKSELFLESLQTRHPLSKSRSRSRAITRDLQIYCLMWILTSTEWTGIHYFCLDISNLRISFRLRVICWSARDQLRRHVRFRQDQVFARRFSSDFFFPNLTHASLFTRFLDRYPLLLDRVFLYVRKVVRSSLISMIILCRHKA